MPSPAAKNTSFVGGDKYTEQEVETNVIYNIATKKPIYKPHRKSETWQGLLGIILGLQHL